MKNRPISKQKTFVTSAKYLSMQAISFKIEFVISYTNGELKNILCLTIS